MAKEPGPVITTKTGCTQTWEARTVETPTRHALRQRIAEQDISRPLSRAEILDRALLRARRVSEGV